MALSGRGDQVDSRAPKQPYIDIVIPTFNQAAMTEACARALVRHTPPGWARIIWVDNGSAPEERAAMAKTWAQTDAAGLPVLPVMVPVNLGFVKATNVGVALSTAPFVLMLNNDTEVPTQWAEALLDVLRADPTIGAVGPRSSSSQQWQGCLAFAPGAYLVPDGRTLAFFCALIRREVIEQVGYLSEEYRAGLCDDDDYAFRMAAAGWKCAVRTDIVVVHHHRTTFRAIYGPGGWLPYQKENTERLQRKWGLSKVDRPMWTLPQDIADKEPGGTSG